MTERIYYSTEELFRAMAPDLLPFLLATDSFWTGIRENSITDEELDGYQILAEDLGMSPEESAIAKAIQVVRDSRNTCLPTPVNLQIYPR